MRKSLVLMLLITFWLLAFISNCFAQVTEAWVATYNGPGNSEDTPSSMTVDDSGNVYVTGGSIGSSSSCFTTVKYNSSGVEQWTARFYDNGNGVADANSIKLDRAGNVYVTGGACIGSSQNSDIIIIKYNNSGIQQWIAVYHTPNADGIGSDLVIDSAGNVYVTGSGNTTPDNSDFITIKYNSLGVQQWVSVYNGPANNIDLASKILIDRSGSLYVKGISWFTPMFFEFTIVKYNNNGVQQWTIRQFGSDNTSSFTSGFTFDRLGNVYLAASSGAAGLQSYLTAKYNSSGAAEWIKLYGLSGLPSHCEASDIVLDTRGNVYVTGYSYSPANLSLQGCTTIKYNSAGVEQWVRIYNGNNNSARGRKIVSDPEGGIYVCGSVDNGYPAGVDYLTIKYDSTGALQWFKMYNGTGSSGDIPVSVKTDNLKNIYVTGWSFGSGGNTDFATIKYSQPIGIHSISTQVPGQFQLYQNYPNPFNPVTKIKLDVPSNVKSKTANVKIVIYDILGKETEVLMDKQMQAGSYEVEWDASNYPSGVYFYKLITDKFTETRKMVLIK
jgi:hypothetical protein